MRKIYMLSIALSFMAFSSLMAQSFKRSAVVPVPKSCYGGFGNIIAGVDLDKDGWPEIYAVNNDVNDAQDTIPRIYKFEFNGVTWDSVWSATPDVPHQNTWPALAVADLDKDGRQELIWMPVNAVDAVRNPNPNRIIVYEANPGKEYMGVDDGFGGYLPNAQTTITPELNVNLRPIRALISDVDSDGKDEIILSDRAGASAVHQFCVVGVDNIPDNGDGSEVWTLKASAKGNTTMGTSAKYDIAVMNNYIYSFAANGKVYPIRYKNGKYDILPVLNNVAGEGASWLSAQTADIDGDGTEEMVVGEFDGNGYIWLVQQTGDSLKSTKIADAGKLGVPRIMGGAKGDIDGDGKIDFVFGSRANANSPHNNAVLRLSYLGGSITDSSSYKLSIVDSLITKTGGDISLLNICNMDGDKENEIVYTSGYPRSYSLDTLVGIVVLDTKETKITGVEKTRELVPTDYYMNQNYPNPFNPTTTIKFGITKESDVDLRIYDMLGKEVSTLINNHKVKAGNYEISFDASRLSSGVYIYSLKTGAKVISRKMTLLK